MKFAMRLTFSVCLLLVAVAAGAASAAAKSAVVLPFVVNAPQSYAYLSKAVQATIQGRLDRPGVLEARAGQNKAASQAEAQQALRSSGADNAIWGSVSVMGNDCTVVMNSVDKAGKTWSKTAQAPVSELTTSVQKLTSTLSQEVFGISSAMRTPGSTASGSPRGATANGDIVTNETGQQQVYLNPQFRYQGAGAEDGSRLRTQRLGYNMVDMAVGDFNGDGKNEIAILSDHDLRIYSWPANGQLKLIGETVVSRSNNNFSMRAIDLNRDRSMALVVTTTEESSNRPYSFIYSFKGNKFTTIADRIPYYVSVMRVPPTYSPTLVGQGWDSLKLFAPGVRIMTKQDGKFTLGTRLDLPTGATVFNCVWLPAGKNGKGEQLVMLTDDERIKLFQGHGNTLVHTTMERYSGSATGMDHYKGMPGLGVDKAYQLPSKYYAPMRLIAADIGNTGDYTLLVNKPISTAAQFFDRYRFFPQGEVHALYWDGVGLGLKWKTRRIRGSVAEIDLADVNNDGILDLVVGLNTSPDLGIGSRQCMITAYPLDVSATNPNVPADLSDFEISPN
ncbi:FG-GAP repeat protein [uncultured Desulfovibrio sp.]|uniref:FG-GAP repeat protein n=1 Tax=uncultured Desulfovibrio sp. TaxID=167968 RepID=A0A212JWR7_9BACT|nr:VCBS repeat-containing protein [Desulfovibrio desulfuricans]MCB6542536.1 VCBS repeat-containing protein [Desulfovibrio desulfuricans]MCB6553498.1 VCBS repeat-containing protein [Desulfovibrio desulfuricans]MCB6565532.1 VCBS repeat-containing protein [Desulfovibrio desulfuricans]MCB7346499.1 VCBS repeat-containing protein [Desulfovibrio desulfuricans]MCQ4860645.1 VCBS repeat-containing protein [Desulfovibrio desulfuricans]